MNTDIFNSVELYQKIERMSEINSSTVKERNSFKFIVQFFKKL